MGFGNHSYVVFLIPLAINERHGKFIETEVLNTSKSNNRNHGKKYLAISKKKIFKQFHNIVKRKQVVGNVPVNIDASCT